MIKMSDGIAIKEAILEQKAQSTKKLSEKLAYVHEEVQDILQGNVKWQMEEYNNVFIPEPMYNRGYHYVSEVFKSYNNPRKRPKLLETLQLFEAANTAYDNYSYLVPEVIAERIYEAAYPHLVARQLLDLVTFTGSTYTIQKATADSVKAFIITELAQITPTTERYSEETVTPEKYGIRVELSTEMIEDARINIFPRHVRLCGEQFAKFENSRLTSIITTNGTAYTGAIPVTLLQILEMMTQINVNDWDADTVVMHPYQMRELMKTDEWRDAMGKYQASSGFVEGALRGQVSNLWGALDILVSSEMTAGTLIVMDRKVAGIIAQNRAITAKRYEDVQRDAQGCLVTQRLKGHIIWSDAVQVCTGYSSS